MRRRIRLLTLIVAAAGCLLTLLGCTTWQSRISEGTFFGKVRQFAPYELSDETRDGDSLLAACEAAKQPGSWFLVLASATVKSDNKFRGFFETAPESSGLFMEYDPQESGNLRVGLAYGSGDGLLVSARTMRRDALVEVIVLISNAKMMRVLSATKDVTRTISSSALSSFACETPVLGSADAISCEDCNVQVNFGYGAVADSPNNLLDDIAESNSTVVRGTLGTLLTLSGMYLIVRSRKIGALAERSLS